MTGEGKYVHASGEVYTGQVRRMEMNSANINIPPRSDLMAANAGQSRGKILVYTLSVSTGVPCCSLCDREGTRRLS